MSSDLSDKIFFNKFFQKIYKQDTIIHAITGQTEPLLNPVYLKKVVEVIDVDDVKEFIKRLKKNEHEMWQMIFQVLVEEHGKFMPGGFKDAKLSTFLGKKIEQYMDIDKLAGEKLIE